MRFFQYILLVIVWVICVIGTITGYYAIEIMPLVSMILIIGGIIVTKDK